MKVIVAKTIISDDVKSDLPDSQILILSGRQCQYLIYPLLLRNSLVCVYGSQWEFQAEEVTCEGMGLGHDSWPEL